MANRMAREEARKNMEKHIKTIYPNAVISTWFEFACEILFYPTPEADLPYSCHLNRLNGNYIISTDF